MNSFKTIIILLLILPFNVSGLQDPETDNFSSTVSIILENNSDKLTHTSQAIIVINNDTRSASAKLYVMEKRNGKWTSILPGIDATIGKKGFAFTDQKKEGDEKTPMGCFSITNAFGYHDIKNPGVYYKKINENSIWITDPESTEYNRMTNNADEAKSYIKLFRQDNLYKYSIIINYNTDPIEKGKGSAIFIHNSLKPKQPTSGGIAIDDNNLLYILKWLTVRKNPKIFIGTDSILASKIY